jgi:choline dehydrogenase-like flavoprotein
MYKTVNRRRFIQTSLATAAAVGVPAARSNAQNRENDAEAIVIGSGFGGAVASLRLGEAGIETIALELLNQANGTALAGPIDQLNTGHPAGGAVLGAVCNNFGEVIGHKNLFVVDGSLIPGSAACANPSLTITALAEQSMDRFLNGRQEDVEAQ